MSLFSFKKLLQSARRPVGWYRNLSLKGKIKYAFAGFAGLVVFFFLCLVVFFYSVYFGLFGKIPTEENLSHINNYQASEVYSSDGELLARYFVENRSDASYNEISKELIQALIDTEDSRFYEHSGVDHRSLMRVLFKSVILRQHAGGGSTLSQQLAKNLFGRKSYGIFTMPVAKIKEAIIANRMEEVYSKEEILTLYLNTVSLGEDTYGVKTASERFFSKSPKELKIEEAAVLVGMLKAPTAYNPRLHPERSAKRRNVVLMQMVRNDHLSKARYDELAGKSIELNYSRRATNEEAGYLKDYLQEELERYLTQYNEKFGTEYDLLTSGLRIKTTIHSKIQHYAQLAVEKHLGKLQNDLFRDLNRKQFFSLKKKGWFNAYIKATPKYQLLKDEGLEHAEIIKELRKREDRLVPYKFEVVDSSISYIDSVITTISQLQAGFMVNNPHTGDVLAWIGGKSYEQSQFDHILSKRQAGSVIKPIVYAKAMVDGRRPCDFILNRQTVYTEYNDWKPKNSNDNYEGKYSLKGALTNSVNTISVKLCMESGIDQVVDFAYQLGISDSITRKPSLCLGVDNFSLFNLMEVYGAFANQGEKPKLNIVDVVYNADNEQIYVAEEVIEKVLDEEIAEDLTQILVNVAQNGTAQRLKNLYHINGVAGKTGTTQNHKDGWFMGYTPEYLGGVWVGADNPSIHFTSIKDGQGANMALPIWANFYNYLKKDSELNYMVRSQFEFDQEFACEDYREENKILKFFRGTGTRQSDATGFKSEKQENRKSKKFKLRDLFK